MPNSKRVKVVQIIPTLVNGGAEKQLVLLASNLDRNRFESHVIVLTHSGPLEKSLRDAGVQVHVIGKRWKGDPFALWTLVRTLRKLQPDIVQTWLFAANSFGRVAARLAKVPVVLSSERCVDPWKSRWQLAIDKRLQQWTSRITANTSAIVDFYSAKGIDRDRFTVIPNAIVPRDGDRLTRSEVFSRLKIPVRSVLIGAVGRLWPQKGYPDLIWASELLHVARPDIALVIIGDGPEMSRLRELRDKYTIKDFCFFAGHRSDAIELIAGMDILWNGSHYEGQSNSILEAMSAGVPVIASDIPGNRDLIEDNVTGLLYPPGDVGTLARSTNLLLKDPTRLVQIGRAARQKTLDEFSLTKMVSSYEELYLSQLAQVGSK